MLHETWIRLPLQPLRRSCGSGVNVGHSRLLDQLFEEHQALGDAAEDLPHADNTLLRSFAEQQRVMKETVKEYRKAAEGFKDSLPIYVPKNTTRQQKPVGIGGKKKKKKADEKPYWYVGNKVTEYYAKMQTDLAAAYDGCQNKEEPESDNFLDALLTMRNFQDQIREILRDLWAKMSDQEIIVAGNPYWPIRFTFGNGGNNTVVVTYDDDGADSKPLDHITPAQFADPLKLANIQDANTKNFVMHNISRACFGLSPFNFKNSLFHSKGDEHLGVMRTNTQRTFNLPARPRKKSADLPGGFADRFGGFAEPAVQPQETSTMSFDDTPEFEGVDEVMDNVADADDDDLDGVGDVKDVAYHIIPNDGNGLLCGIFALHDSIRHQIPATDIPAGRNPTDEELHDQALNGPAAQVLNTILPNEVHTRNFTADHLASILQQWGQHVGMAEPLQLGIILQDRSRWLMPVNRPQDSPEPRRIWIEHQGDLHGKGGHYNGLAPGEADKNRRTRVTPKVAQTRMDLKAKLEMLARNNMYGQGRLKRDEDDFSDPESVGAKTKRLEGEKKRREERQQAREAVEKQFRKWKLPDLKAKLKAEGVKGYSQLRKEKLFELLVKHEMKNQARGKPLADDDSEDEARSSQAGSEDEELPSDYLESDDEDEDHDEDRSNDNTYRGVTGTAELVRRLESFQFQKRKEEKRKQEKSKKQQGITAADKEPEGLLQKRPPPGQLKDFKQRKREKKKVKDERGLNKGPKGRSKKGPGKMEEE